MVTIKQKGRTTKTENLPVRDRLRRFPAVRLQAVFAKCCSASNENKINKAVTLKTTSILTFGSLLYFSTSVCETKRRIIIGKFSKFELLTTFQVQRLLYNTKVSTWARTTQRSLHLRQFHTTIPNNSFDVQNKRVR